MKDRYPPTSVPAHCLVAPQDQPDYTEPNHDLVGAWANVGYALSDAHVCAGHGDDLAMIHADTARSYTFSAIAEVSTLLAQGLMALGVVVGDRIALRGPNVPELIIGMLAVWKAGGVVVPTPLQAQPEELRFFLDDTSARFLVVVAATGDDLAVVAEAVAGSPIEEVFTYGDTPSGAGPYRDLRILTDATEIHAAPLPTTPSDAVAVLWHTGGTTGQPKGCYHTHRRFLLGGYALGAVTAAARGQRWAAAAPAGHALGFMYHTTGTLLHGSTTVLIENFRDPQRVVAAIADFQVNVFTAITATWARMIDVLDENGRDLPSLRRAYAMWQSASSADVRMRWQKRGITLINNYGSTAFATWPMTPRHDEDFPAASLGRPLPGYIVAAVQRTGSGLQVIETGRGQMAVRGLTGLTYWNRPELQRRDVVDGWSICDDLIEFDGTGNAAYLGRTDYLISTSGYKVAPVEVENVLSTHTAVREVAVVGAPDPIRQEIVVAFIAVRPGVPTNDELATELQAHVRNRLSPYKAPRRFHFVTELPRDPVGKIRGKVLQTWAADGAAPAPSTPDQKPRSLQGGDVIDPDPTARH
ncbi:MAG TPA: acyl-CoA synthetase [Mycobacterium sp.]|jgi:2-aminobenzoate-CoA ligase|nr:acyl-CoA synthetase [Mycobacterium sp.]